MAYCVVWLTPPFWLSYQPQQLDLLGLLDIILKVIIYIGLSFESHQQHVKINMYYINSKNINEVN